MQIFGVEIGRRANPDPSERPAPRSTIFAPSEIDLINEIALWIDGAVKASGGQTQADLRTLHEALTRVSVCMRAPDRSFPSTLRVDAMDVLRRQGEDQSGLDPIAVCRAARMLAQAAPAGARVVESKAVIERMTTMRQEIQSLLAKNAALEQRCAALEEMIAIMQEPVTAGTKP